MKKINFIILTVILMIAFLAIEVVIVRSASKYEPMVTAVYTRVKIPKDTVITKNMLEEREVALSVAHKQCVKNIGDAVGKTAGVELAEGEAVLSFRLLEVKEDSIPVENKDNRLFSVEFKGDQANGWWLKAEQRVDILFVPNRTAVPFDGSIPQTDAASGAVIRQRPEDSVVRLENIRVAALIDEKGKLLKETDRSILPKYVSFEVTKEQDEFLAYAKGNGRLEISVIPQGK